MVTPAPRFASAQSALVLFAQIWNDTLMNGENTTHGTVMISAPQKQAGKIAERIIEEKLGACAQVLPKIESYFWWEGEVQHESESLILVKTTQRAQEKIEALLEEIHPYDVPELVFLPITGGLQAYLSWIEESVIWE